MIKSVWVYGLIIYFVLSFFNEGISLPENPNYLLITILVLSFTVMIACPLLSFLTIKCKFPTFFLMSTLLLVGILFILKMFMIDFYIDTYTFEGVELGTMQIRSFEVIPIISIVVVSLVCSFFCGIYRELDSN